MNAHSTISAAKPTLEQRLRYTTLAMVETIREAERILIENGEISPHKPPMHELPSPRGKRIAKLANDLLLEAMEREGLPLSLLPVREPSAFEDMLPDMSARHPLAPVQSTWGMGGAL